MSVHTRRECKHGTVVSNCRCISPDKTVTIVPCPAYCPVAIKKAEKKAKKKRPIEAEEITFHFAVTIAAKEGGTILRALRGRDYYVKSPQGTDSLHPFDVLDVIRTELSSADAEESGRIADCLWHVKSVKQAKGVNVIALDEDAGTETPRSV